MNTVNSVIVNADEAASIVLCQAMWAAAQGTFAVGGAIVENATGRIIHAMHNNVLKPLKSTGKVFTYDPTAHGERQLVYWYYANKDKLELPEPDKLTIVTSLDPCVMCAGALLTAGFNVAVVAMDDLPGINFDRKFTFHDLPPNLRDLAKSKFGYYACGDKDHDPIIYVRKYVGGSDVAFNKTIVNAQRLIGCGNIMKVSSDTVRKNISDGDLSPNNLSDPAILPEDSPIKKEYRAVYSDAFKMKVPIPRLPNTELFNVLMKVKDSESNAKNAVALLDPFGNVILCLPDTFDKSPVHTAFMNVTRSYAITRFGLMDNEATREQARNYLTHPKYGTFVFLYAPDPGDTTTIMTLGAYGSTLEGDVPVIFPANFQYYLPPSEGTVEELRSVIINLPPFYTQCAKISIMEVAVSIDQKKKVR